VKFYKKSFGETFWAYLGLQVKKNSARNKKYMGTYEKPRERNAQTKVEQLNPIKHWQAGK
jgi:hypothetical protein